MLEDIFEEHIELQMTQLAQQHQEEDDVTQRADDLQPEHSAPKPQGIPHTNSEQIAAAMHLIEGYPSHLNVVSVEVG